ncbi:uncharacterized protein EDB93DRAFT_1162528 [Suillus bovinus]|uniref:uncharacterized protein n=1 Tax=Suillus bovinus TaxID=48563 RepID=UPI001B86B70B|nr:uncharacterized protein EDB93DRAFT_1162528 [Suillus bovinus]KAG2139807.1 hypothetical protein EDB93DRAFT_1162528 [Suillus bovinus]
MPCSSPASFRLFESMSHPSRTCLCCTILKPRPVGGSIFRESFLSCCIARMPYTCCGSLLYNPSALYRTGTAVFRNLHHTSYSQWPVVVVSPSSLQAHQMYRRKNFYNSLSSGFCHQCRLGTLEREKINRRSSGNDNDNETKSSKRPRSQKEDYEEPSYPEDIQDPGEIHLSHLSKVRVVIVAIRATDLTLGLQGIPCGGQG